MTHADLKIITGIFLIQNKQILLLEKKTEHGSVWTIPFKTVYGSRHPSAHIKDMIQDYFDIQVEPNHFIKKLTVNKLDKHRKATFGYFPSTITREGDIKLNQQKGFEKFQWFAYDELPQNITSDLQQIIWASDEDKTYIEIVEDLA